MTSAVQLFIELELIGEESEFEATFQEISEIAATNEIRLSYNFYREPSNPTKIYAIEKHDDVDSLERHFEAAMPALQKAWACARPIKTLILGNLPPHVKTMMEQNGCTVVQTWIEG